MLCADIQDYHISDKSRIVQLQDALGASKLTHLTLKVDVSCRGYIAPLLDAAAATPALHFLKVTVLWCDGYYYDRQDISKDLGRAFGVLLARDMPSLHTLDVCGCGLVDAALFRLLAGLSANTHLRKLELKLQPY